MQQLSIYKASAGSGKTFKLTEYYLTLALENPEKYRNILAVTFTHKATGEMKARIIKVLDELARGASSDYKQLLQQRLKISDEEIAHRAKRVLSNILHDYSRFNIGTIDSFFQRVIRSFIREIGLQTGLAVELDNDKVIKNVIDRLFLDIDDNPELKSWMTSFAESRIEEGKSWNFSAELQSFSKEVFKEDFQEHENILREKLQDKSFIKNYQAKLYRIINDFEKKLIDFGNRGIGYLDANALSIDDFSYKKTGPAGYFLKLRKKEYEMGTRVQKAMVDTAAWAGKSAPKRDIIQSLAEMQLMPLLQEVEVFIDGEKQKYHTSKAILKNIYVLGIVSDISKKIREYASDKSIFLLADATKFLKEIINESDVPFIYEKVGNFYNHFMIDEFQDTSEAQWKNFLPLIENSLAQGNPNLLVGDVKQSIYRWRNSNWNLLAEEVEQQFRNDQLDINSLDYNWRSKEDVIRFNNTVFKVAASILQNEINAIISEKNYKDDLSALETKIVNAYDTLVQQIPEKSIDSGGYTECRFLECATKGEYNELLMPVLLEQIQELQDQGIEPRDIAILVRRQSEGKLIANYLLEQKLQQNEASNYKYDVISNEALFISNSRAVKLILSILRYLKDANNQIYHAFIYKEYLSNNEEVNPFENVHWKKAYEASEINEQPFNEWMESLKKRPLFELVDEIILKLKIGQRKEDLPFVLSFQDLVKEHVSKGNADINTFMNWWDEFGERQTISVSDNQNAISILTIHKSKGLEFKAVLVPFCNWSVDNEQSNILWVNTTDESFADLPTIPVDYRSLGDTIFYKEYLTEKMQTYVDNLNLMYVAFTRAEDVLMVNAPISKKDKTIKHAGHLLNYAFMHQSSFNEKILVDLHTHYDEEKNIFRFGKLGSYKEKEVSEELKLSDYYARSYHERLSLKYRSEDYFLSTKKENAQLNYGRLMHDIFASIKHMDDIESAINDLVHAGRLPSDEVEALHAKIRFALNDIMAQSWFTGDYRVLNEIDILTPGEGDLRPDRVLINEDRIVVVDYKFGNNKLKSHKTQVKNYIEHIRSMGYDNIQAYLWYFELGEIEAVK